MVDVYVSSHFESRIYIYIFLIHIKSDQKGNLYLFSVLGNRYQLLRRTSMQITSMAFSVNRRALLVVGFNDGCIRCFDTDSKQLVSSLYGHASSVRCITFLSPLPTSSTSPLSSGSNSKRCSGDVGGGGGGEQARTFALTSSQDAIILWDTTREWKKCKVLDTSTMSPTNMLNDGFMNRVRREKDVEHQCVPNIHMEGPREPIYLSG